MHNLGKVESLLTLLQKLAMAENPAQKLQNLAQQLQELFLLVPSTKHPSRF